MAWRSPSPLECSPSPMFSSAKLLQALLQNTLEQTVLAFPVYLAASLVFPARFLPMVAAAAALLVVGRIRFFRGYARGAPSRAAGFGLTFYPSVALLVPRSASQPLACRSCLTSAALWSHP